MNNIDNELEQLNNVKERIFIELADAEYNLNEILDEIEIIMKKIKSKQEQLNNVKDIEVEKGFLNPPFSYNPYMYNPEYVLEERNSNIKEEIKGLKQELRNLKIDYLIEVEMKKQIRTEI